MSRSSERPHWLVEAAAAAGLQTSGLELPPDSKVATVWAAVTRGGGASDEALADAVAAHYGLQVANLEAAERTAQRLVPANLAMQYQVFPLREDDRHLVIATCDPNDLFAQDAIAFASGRRTVSEVASPTQVSQAIKSNYSPERDVEDLIRSVDHESD